MTPFFAFLVLWVVLPTFNFGFGTSELNPLQKAITCAATGANVVVPGLPSCLSMSNAEFGFVTAAFTIGGLIGSIGLIPLRRYIVALQGRSRNVLILSGLCNLLGGLVQAASTSWHILAVGRLFMGMGSGIALVTVPPYLNDISPPSMQGSIGVLNQLSIVIGILSAQALGVSSLGDLPPSPSQGPWRIVPLISSAMAAIQLLLSPLAVNPPSESDDAKALKAKLWGHKAVQRSGDDDDDEAQGLLNDDHSEGERREESIPPLRLLRLAFSPLTTRHASLQRGTRMMIFTQMAQQLSGVNAVLYFSTGIMTDVLGQTSDPNKTARLIGLGITFVNFVMTFPPIPLINEQRVGRKNLMLFSSSTMATASVLLGFAIGTGKSTLAAVSIVAFVAGFSVGLGAIPFLILPELVPRAAVASASSVGIGCNWTANILLATFFLPLKDAVGGANTFYIFAGIDFVIFCVLARFYVYAPQPQS